MILKTKISNGKHKRCKIAALLCFFLLSASFLFYNSKNKDSKNSVVQYTDYSKRGGNYIVLDGILLDANKVEFKGRVKSSFADLNLQSYKFDVEATVIAQTGENSSTTEMLVERRQALYSLSITPDRSGKIKSIFLEVLCDSTKQDKYGLSGGGIIKKDMANDFILYLSPVSEWPGEKYNIYYSGNLIQLTFNGFVSGSAWGGLSSFSHQNLRFKLPHGIFSLDEGKEVDCR